MTDTTRLTGAVVVRQDVPLGRPYATYRQYLRQDFYWACAYCTITENEASGLGFEIDHYDPQTQGGGDSYDNLYYACHTCNGKKKDWKSRPVEVTKGYYPLRIDLEDPRPHFSLAPTAEGEIDHRTPTGEFNKEFFSLNRQALKRIRKLRQRLAVSEEAIVHGLRILKNDLRIDALPKQLRWKVIQMREALDKQGKAAIEAIGNVLREICASELLDPDPQQGKRTKERRKYLKELKAILPKEDPSDRGNR